MTTELIVPLLMIAFWVFWTFCSETSHNHGRWIAFLLPPAMVLWLVAFVLFHAVRLILYPVFLLLGRRKAYTRFMARLRHMLDPF